MLEENMSEGTPKEQMTKGSNPFALLPAEIRDKIYELAIGNGIVRPTQVKRGSNMFKCEVPLNSVDPHYAGCDYEPTIMHNYSGVKTFTALMKTCSLFYQDLTEYPVLYATNMFQFANDSDLLVYLAAITPGRRRALRMIELNSSFSGKIRFAFALLAQCVQLRTIRFMLNNFGRFNFSDSRLDEFERAVRHLSGIDVQVRLSGDPWTVKVSGNLPVDNAWQTRVFKVLELPREERTPVSAAMTGSAMVASRLLIYGEGRCQDDKRPFFVSARTRSSLKRQRALGDDGTPPTPKRPKYSDSGALQWEVCSIWDSRMGPDGPEFRSALCQETKRGMSHNHVSYGMCFPDRQWERLSVLMDHDAEEVIFTTISHIETYYRKLRMNHMSLDNLLQVVPPAAVLEGIKDAALLDAGKEVSWINLLKEHGKRIDNVVEFKKREQEGLKWREELRRRKEEDRKKQQEARQREEERRRKEKERREAVAKQREAEKMQLMIKKKQRAAERKQRDAEKKVMRETVKKLRLRQVVRRPSQSQSQSQSQAQATTLDQPKTKTNKSQGRLANTTTTTTTTTTTMGGDMSQNHFSISPQPLISELDYGIGGDKVSNGSSDVDGIVNGDNTNDNSDH